MKLLKAIFLMALVSLAVSCGDDKKEEKKSSDDTTETAPIAPPSTLTVDADFGAVGESGSSLNLTTTKMGLASAAAGITVGVWSTFLKIYFAVPALAFAAALNETPTYDSETNTWTWTHTVSSGGTKTFKLQGTPVDGGPGATWKMIIDSNTVDGNGCCENFEWISGTTSGTGTGSWSFKDPKDPDEDATALTVEWEVTSETDRMLNIKNTNKSTDGDEFGYNSTVKYERKGDDFTFTTFNSANSNTIVVKQDLDTKAGSWKNGTKDAACWDTDLKDITCDDE